MIARIVLTAAGVEVEVAKVNRESNLSSDAVIRRSYVCLFCHRIDWHFVTSIALLT